MENKDFKYVLFDIGQLSEIEKDIILALGDDINNPPVPGLCDPNAKFMSKTKDILRSFDLDILFESISLLCIKDILGITNSNPRTLENHRGFITNNGSQPNLIALIRLIIDRLRESRWLLLNSGKDLLIDLETPESKIDEKIEKDLVSQLTEILHSHEEYVIGDIKSICEKYINFFENRDTSDEFEYYRNAPNKNIGLIATIEEARLLIDIYKEKSIIDALKLIIKKYYDNEKVLECKIIFLTSHNNGINGVHVFEALKLNKAFESFSEKFEETKNLKIEISEIRNNISKERDRIIEDVNDKINKNLIRTIEILSIFVAVITIIIGNVSFIPQISEKTTLGTVSLILIINGSLICGVTLMMLLMTKITNLNLRFKFLYMLIPIIILALGIALLFFDNFNLNISQESTNNFTINSLNTLDEQPTNITDIENSESPEIELMPIPTPTLVE